MSDQEEPIRGMERVSLTAQNAERKRDNDRRRVAEKRVEEQLRPSLWTRLMRRLRRGTRS
jgi:hypothetical protein